MQDRDPRTTEPQEESTDTTRHKEGWVGGWDKRKKKTKEGGGGTKKRQNRGEPKRPTGNQRHHRAHAEKKKAGEGKRAPEGVRHGGVCSSVLDTNPCGVGGGGGVREGGRGSKFFSFFGAFLNAFECPVSF